MARKPMVTRTIVSTQVNVLCLNLVTTEPFSKLITLPGTYKDEKTIMKQVSAEVDNKEVKAVNVLDKEIIKKLYGMSEAKFIKNAEELPARVKADK